MDLPYMDDCQLTGPLVKPSRLDVEVRKYHRRTAAQAAKHREDRAHDALMQELRKQAYARDRGLCRAFNYILKLHTDNPEQWAHPHHFIFRSLGGRDELSNIITLSRYAHELIHRHKTLEIAGDPMGTLIFTRHYLDQGRSETWTSTVGERNAGMETR